MGFAKKYINKIIFIFFLLTYILLIYKKKRLIIFDIDNTLADTWPSFLENYDSDKERLTNLKPFKSIVKIVLNYESEGNKIIFMSARPYFCYKLTKNWLVRNCTKDFDLILVSNPFEKLKLLKLFRDKEIIFYDDLSHSHEKGFIAYYEDVLRELSNLNNVKHIDYSKLQYLQKDG